MAKAEEKTRIFGSPDADMLQTSRVTHGLFTEDKLAFSNFDPSFADPFGDNWLQKIDNTFSVDQDTEYVNTLSELTLKVDDIMEECKTFFQLMKYFIEKAYPGQKTVHAQFGYGDYDQARNSEVKMIQLLGVLSKTANERSVKLIEAGFTQDKIDYITALKEKLTEADYNQEITKKKRTAVTQDRISALNECYEILQRVSKAGKIIFASDRAKYDQYLLPNERSEKKEAAAPTQTTSAAQPAN
jgi:hypothetical protein